MTSPITLRESHYDQEELLEMKARLNCRKSMNTIHRLVLMRKTMTQLSPEILKII